jgi:poly-D-alanine transfer protein DltD
MTDKQIEEKALEAYPPEYEQEDFDETWDMNEQYREPYIKALKEIESLPKIKGWVARDQQVDEFYGNGLILHHSKPTREGNEWSSKTIAMHLPLDFFPDLTWESDPIEVELLIRKV